MLHYQRTRSSMRGVGEGGPLVKHFLAGLPPVTALTQRKSSPANAHKYLDIARGGLDVANSKADVAATTADQNSATVLRYFNIPRLQLWDTRRRVHVRRRLVKNPTNCVSGQTVLREDCPKAKAESVHGIAEETDGLGFLCSNLPRSGIRKEDHELFRSMHMGRSIKRLLRSCNELERPRKNARMLQRYFHCEESAPIRSGPNVWPLSMPLSQENAHSHQRS